MWLGYTSQKYRRNTEIFEWILCILTLFYRRDILFLPLGSETIMDQQNRLSLLGWAVTKMLFLVQLVVTKMLPLKTCFRFSLFAATVLSEHN